jgi:GTP pyrophosphokinase
MNQTTEEKELSDKLMIQHEYELLLEDYKECGHNLNFDLVNKAFNFANKAHAGARRRSGEPYMMHPLAVARIVTKEIGLGTTSVCSALLHDVVEDTDYTVEDIEGLFTKRIATIVDGLTKIAGGVFGDRASSQAENFRKLIFTSQEDVRVIMIKIADRLHNMRTLNSMPPAKQYKIAGETLYIYAPLAHRLGLFKIKTELEDLSFRYEHPEICHQLQERLAVGDKEREDLYAHFVTPIQKSLDELGYEYKIEKRIKTIYSIWRKMQKKNIPFEEVYDLMAVRIIYKPQEGISEQAQAWMIYSTITKHYKPHPERTRDWVSSPKANGYEALHLTVMSPDGQWVEVQIRSERMHDIAEKGISAHWKYKDGEHNEDTELDNWVNTIKDLLENPEPNAIDFLDTFKMNLYATEIFVFTPKGDIKTLPQNATALDFAFSLHTDIGFQCIGAKVNHKLVPLSQVLKSGDQVEILTSKKQVPQSEWLDFVSTAQAKSKLKAFFRKEMRQLIEKGKVLLEEKLASLNIVGDQATIQKLMNFFNVRQKQDLYYEIGKGVFSLDEVENVLQKKEKKPNKWMHYLKTIPSFVLFKKKKKENEEDFSVVPTKIDKKKILQLSVDPKLSATPYEVASCCNPIPGDEVIAFINEDGVSVTLHKRNCSVADKLKANFGERIIQVEWATSQDAVFPVTLEISGIDEQGVLMKIIDEFNKESFSVQKVDLDTKDGIFGGQVRVLVHHTEDINNLCVNISKIKAVVSVNRVEK